MTEIELKEFIARAKVEKREQLDLYRSKLQVLTPEIGDLTNLKRIHLERNQLTQIPESIGNLIVACMSSY
jgi:Leucine-rich repeat (LRR) protein